MSFGSIYWTSRVWSPSMTYRIRFSVKLYHCDIVRCLFGLELKGGRPSMQSKTVRAQLSTFGSLES